MWEKKMRIGKKEERRKRRRKRIFMKNYQGRFSRGVFQKTCEKDIGKDRRLTKEEKWKKEWIMWREDTWKNWKEKWKSKRFWCVNV